MHSSFLLTETGWTLTNNPAVVLAHSGELLINEDKDELETNLLLIGNREGKDATLRHNQVILSDRPIFERPDQAYDELQECGEALCFDAYDFSSSKNGEWQAHRVASYVGQEERDRLAKKWHGIVAKREGNLTRLVRDEELWRGCQELDRKAERKAHLQNLRSLPRAYDLECVADQCAHALGCSGPKSFRIEQLWTWLAAHDVAFGRRATNKKLSVLAKKWCNNRQKSKKWLARWACEEIAERTDKRLAAVLRLGSKNKRVGAR